MSIEVVSGSVSTVTGLGKDEAWLGTWLKEDPARLGLGSLASEGEVADDGSFVATAGERRYSVDVQLGEMEASRGFGVLDHWARDRALHPDKTHVAVLVTETLSDRYETTLQALAEHLPLVVVELQVWKGESEAIVVPHVALASDDVDLSDTPAAQAAEALAKTAAAETPATTATTDVVSEADAAEAEAAAEAELTSAETDSDGVPENKDDTGVGNPWGLDDADDGSYAGGNGSKGLFSKVGN